MGRDIIIAMMSSLVTAFVVYISASSAGLLDKELQRGQIKDLADELSENSDFRTSLLNEMEMSGKFVGPPGPVGPMGPEGPSGGGAIAKVTHVSSNERIESGVTTPYDNSAPRRDEGAKVLEVTFEPKERRPGQLLVEVLVYAVEKANKGDNLIVALFKDDDVEAVASATNYIGIHEHEYAGLRPVPLRHVIRHEGKPIKLLVRVGMNNGTVEVNSDSDLGSPRLGSSIHSSLTVFELRSEQ
jgi:hypothetical protein